MDLPPSSYQNPPATITNKQTEAVPFIMAKNQSIDCVVSELLELWFRRNAFRAITWWNELNYCWNWIPIYVDHEIQKWDWMNGWLNEWFQRSQSFRWLCDYSIYSDLFSLNVKSILSRLTKACKVMNLCGFSCICDNELHQVLCHDNFKWHTTKLCGRRWWKYCHFQNINSYNHSKEFALSISDT